MLSRSNQASVALTPRRADAHAAHRPCELRALAVHLLISRIWGRGDAWGEPFEV